MISWKLSLSSLVYLNRKLSSECLSPRVLVLLLELAVLTSDRTDGGSSVASEALGRGVSKVAGLATNRLISNGSTRTYKVHLRSLIKGDLELYLEKI